MAPGRIRPGGFLVPPMDIDGFRDGLRTMAPAAVALGVWGVVTGVAMVNSGLTVWQGVLFNLLAFAGSAQVATSPMLVSSTPLPVVWVAAALVNIRFLIFSAATSRSFTHLPRRQRLFAAYFNGDVPYAMFSGRFGIGAGDDYQVGFYFGITVINYTTWHVFCTVGILLGNLAPASWGLELAAALCLLAVMLPMLVNRPAVLGMVVAGVVSLAAVRLPLKLGLLVAMGAGLATCLLAETWPGPGTDPPPETPETMVHE